MCVEVVRNRDSISAMMLFGRAVADTAAACDTSTSALSPATTTALPEEVAARSGMGAAVEMSAVGGIGGQPTGLSAVPLLSVREDLGAPRGPPDASALLTSGATAGVCEVECAASGTDIDRGLGRPPVAGCTSLPIAAENIAERATFPVVIVGLVDKEMFLSEIAMTISRGVVERGDRVCRLLDLVTQCGEGTDEDWVTTTDAASVLYSTTNSGAECAAPDDARWEARSEEKLDDEALLTSVVPVYLLSSCELVRNGVATGLYRTSWFGDGHQLTWFHRVASCATMLLAAAAGSGCARSSRVAPVMGADEETPKYVQFLRSYSHAILSLSPNILSIGLGGDACGQPQISVGLEAMNESLVKLVGEHIAPGLSWATWQHDQMAYQRAPLFGERPGPVLCSDSRPVVISVDAASAWLKDVTLGDIAKGADRETPDVDDSPSCSSPLIPFVVSHDART